MAVSPSKQSAITTSAVAINSGLDQAPAVRLDFYRALVTGLLLSVPLWAPSPR